MSFKDFTKVTRNHSTLLKVLSRPKEGRTIKFKQKLKISIFFEFSALWRIEARKHFGAWASSALSTTDWNQDVFDLSSPSAAENEKAPYLYLKFTRFFLKEYTTTWKLNIEPKYISVNECGSNTLLKKEWMLSFWIFYWTNTVQKQNQRSRGQKL